MTNEEAINNLRLYCYGCDHSDECGECEIHIACNALEKQIPKKPTIKNGNTIGMNSGQISDMKFACCPNCQKTILWEDEIPQECDAHCSWCGQAIDWNK